MNAYWAIIKDSFREAFSSRVLPLLLVIFTLALVSLAPLGLKELSTADLTFDDIIDARGLVARLQQADASDAPSPGKHIWNRIPESFRKQMTPTEEDRGGQFRARALLRVELNRQLEEPAFFNAAAWKDIDLTEEARTLSALPAGTLTPEQTARLNRVALESAFPALIVQSPKTSVKLSYFGSDIPILGEVISQFSIERSEVQKWVQRLLSFFCRYFLGVFGVFVAILVSAAIIPRMFEPGSIDLLLSKPVSRPMLFLTKFFSGCAFILVNVAYFMTGLWLLVGIRFGVWSGKLLLTIPLFLFVFMLVYSISAIAGVLWRNPIVSVMVSVLVWMICMAVGFAKNSMDVIWNSASFAQVVPAGDTLIATSKSGQTFSWNASIGAWQETLRGTAPSNAGPGMGMSSPFLGLLYDRQRDQLLGVQSTLSPLGLQTAGGVGPIVIGRRDDGWERTPGIAAPAGTSAIFLDRKGRLLAVGTSGIYRCDADPSTTHRPFKVFGIDLAGKPQEAAFVRKGPDDAPGWFLPFAAAQNKTDDSLAIYDRGTLRTYALNANDAYERRAERKFEPKSAVVLGAGGSNVLLANADGEILVLDGRSLETKGTFTPFGKSEPRSITVSPDARWFAVLYHRKSLWLYDAANETGTTRGITGQGDITAAAFSDEGKLLVAHYTNRVASLSLDPLKSGEQWNPPTEGWDHVYRHGIVPLYTIFPKPGDLDYLINYLFTDEETEGTSKDNLQAERHVVDMWKPVWSNLIFLTVVLGLTCWYVSRKDF